MTPDELADYLNRYGVPRESETVDGEIVDRGPLPRFDCPACGTAQALVLVYNKFSVEEAMCTNVECLILVPAYTCACGAFLAAGLLKCPACEARPALIGGDAAVRLPPGWSMLLEQRVEDAKNLTCPCGAEASVVVFEDTEFDEDDEGAVDLTSPFDYYFGVCSVPTCQVHHVLTFCFECDAPKFDDDEALCQSCEAKPRLRLVDELDAEADSEGGPVIQTLLLVKREGASTWEGLGAKSFAIVPRIGETIVLNIEDAGHAFRVVDVRHFEASVTIYATHLGLALDAVQKLFERS